MTISRPAVEQALIARAGADPAFRARLLQDPRAVLVEAGVVLPEAVEVRAVEETADLIYLVIPAEKKSAPLTSRAGDDATPPPGDSVQRGYQGGFQEGRGFQGGAQPGGG